MFTCELLFCEYLKTHFNIISNSTFVETNIKKEKIVTQEKAIYTHKFLIKKSFFIVYNTFEIKRLQ